MEAYLPQPLRAPKRIRTREFCRNRTLHACSGTGAKCQHGSHILLIMNLINRNWSFAFSSKSAGMSVSYDTERLIALGGAYWKFERFVMCIDLNTYTYVPGVMVFTIPQILLYSISVVEVSWAEEEFMQELLRGYEGKWVLIYYDLCVSHVHFWESFKGSFYNC